MDKRIMELWSILDDIDTLLDMFKETNLTKDELLENRKSFKRSVVKQVKKRFDIYNPEISEPDKLPELVQK